MASRLTLRIQERLSRLTGSEKEQRRNKEHGWRSHGLAPVTSNLVAAASFKLHC